MLALGVLFILSASFLAVQLWSDDEPRRGIAQALEAPIVPPSAPKVIAPPPVKKTPEKAVVEVPAEPAVVEKAEPAAEEPAKPAVEAAPVKMEAPVDINAAEVKPVEPVRAPVTVVAPAKEVKAPKLQEKKAVSAPRKARKSRKKAAKVEEIPTEIPAEWNWFSKPLKLSFAEGKTVIVPSDEPGEVVLASTTAVKVQQTVTVVAHSESEDTEEAVEVAPETGRPFMAALAKMAKLRQMRATYAAARPEIKQPEPVADAEMSPSLRRIGEMLRMLEEKLDRRAAASMESAEKSLVEDSSEVSSSAASTAETEDKAAPVADGTSEKEEVSAEPQFKPYYGGSGSSFSNRVNELIKRGEWLRD